jgi:hypothetical protein
MPGAIPPLPQYNFMAWCSVKAQGQLYLYLYSTTGKIVVLYILIFRFFDVRWEDKRSWTE